MAKKLSSLLFLLALINVAFATRQQHQPRFQGQSQSECQFQRIQALEPTNQIKADAGLTEVWDHDDEQLRCAGVTVIRHTIEPNGLLLPSYTNAPQLIYVIKGKGVQGTLIPGCPETYQSGQSEFEGQQEREDERHQPGGGRRERHEREDERHQPGGGRRERHEREDERFQPGGGRRGPHEREDERFQPGGGRREEQGGRSRHEEGQSQSHGRRFQDRHQKIRHFRAGDILALPAGVSQWVYNDGNEPLIAVVLLDTTNFANQLDINPKRFYLAGNPQEEHQQQSGGRQQQGSKEGRRGSQGTNKNNVFSGLDTEWLSEVFNVDKNLIEKLQGQNDERGNIIKVERGLQFVSPPHKTEREQQGRGRSSRGESEWRHGGRGDNGFEETLCTMRLRENINDPERADIYTPRGGRISTINSLNLPVLSWLDLSAERGVLYQNGLVSPHYYMNAHSITYVTRGRAKVQVVNDQGQTVFDDVVSEGQLVVEPQNYVILRQALEDGYEYISFKTSDNALRNNLAGRNSVFQGLPAGVIANAYQISLEDAKSLKFNRDETTVFQGQKSSERLAVA